MKRAWTVSLLTTSLGLVVASVFVFLTPTSVLSANGFANCRDGSIVNCVAYKCDCRDYVGCTATDFFGNSRTTNCPGVTGGGY